MTFQLRPGGPSRLPKAYRFSKFYSMVVTAGIAAVMVSLSSPADAATLDATTPSEVEQKGEYLVAAGNCMSCHTNGDDSPFAGGLEFETPFGTVYSTNITSDLDRHWPVEP